MRNIVIRATSGHLLFAGSSILGVSGASENVDAEDEEVTRVREEPNSGVFRAPTCASVWSADELTAEATEGVGLVAVANCTAREVRPQGEVQPQTHAGGEGQLASLIVDDIDDGWTAVLGAR
jgi:hypothetical protein